MRFTKDHLAIWTILVVLFTTSISFGDLTDGLVTYWSFDNTGDAGHDDSGNGHSLTIPGPWSSVPGALGSGISFEEYAGGTNWGPSPLGPYTSTSGMGYPSSDGFTVSFWAELSPESETIGNIWPMVKFSLWCTTQIRSILGFHFGMLLLAPLI
jgi:hypothetical protein